MQLLCPATNKMFDRQRMSNKEQVILNNQHQKQYINLTIRM